MSTDAPSPIRTGGCLCGAVRYEVRGRLRHVINCHCGQCRRTHGAYGPYSNVAKSHLTLVEEKGLAWYPSSHRAKRGFCNTCGSSLFWSAGDTDTISISAGTLDQPTGLRTIGNIFVDGKGDFYDLHDDLPGFPAGSKGALDGDTS